MDATLVGGRAKPKESDQDLRDNCPELITPIHLNSLLFMKILIAGILSIAVIVCCSNSSLQKESEVQQIKSDLPNLSIQLNDGSKVSVKDLPGKVALILFFPDCDHCQREAAQIQKNINGFKDYTLYFISSASFEEINHFATTYQLHNYKNVVFARTESQNVIDVLGPIETPTLYLFDKNGKLIETFSGEVAIEVVLKYI
jgi:peroxiredoxin